MDTQAVFTATSGDTQCITIGIIDDDNFEDAHSFTVEISGIEPLIATGLGSMVQVEIHDNDGNVCV